MGKKEKVVHPLAGKKKPRNQKCICKYCGNTFFAADVKASVCDSCKDIFKCEICGVKVGVGSKYCAKHVNTSKKGKTYLEIYGTSTPKCGFRKGEENVAKRLDVRKKISDKVKDSYTPELRELRREQAIKLIKEGKFTYRKKVVSDGITFRSQFEVDVKNILNELGIGWEYEKRTRIGNRTFLPDFTITTDDFFTNFVSNNVSKTILLEVTGSAFTRWRQDFLDRLDYIIENDKDDNYRIFIVTYPDVYYFYSFLSEKYKSKVHVFSFGNPKITEHQRFIKVDNVTNFDYTHFLPFHKGKCKMIHGHSSKISVEIGGIMGLEREPWLMDFGTAKKIVKEVCDEYDHKLLINKNAVKSLVVNDNIVKVKYDLKDGTSYSLELPKKTVKIIEDHSTAENLAMSMAREIGGKLPEHLYHISVTLNEGFNNKSKAIYQKGGHEERLFGSHDFIKCLKYHLVF